MLARRGVRVAVGDLDAEGALEVAERLGDGALGARLDVADAQSFRRFLDLVEERLGPVDALVNNAGVMHLGGFLEEPEEVTRATFAVNVWGLINGMRAALPRMIERGGGHVVNVTSLAGKVPLPGAAVYAASKYAAVGLTEGVREELRDAPVEISQVLPTMVDTEFAAGVPTGRGLRPVRPEQVAEAIVGALEAPGRDVYVPAVMRAVEVGAATLPKPVIGLLRRVVGDHRTLTDLDAEARAEYEERLAAQGREP
jgi:hypothetical protein